MVRKIGILVLIVILAGIIGCQVNDTNQQQKQRQNFGKWEVVYQDTDEQLNDSIVRQVKKLKEQYTKNPDSDKLFIDYRKTSSQKVISGIPYMMGGNSIYDNGKELYRVLIGIKGKGVMHFKPFRISEVFTGYRLIAVYRLINEKYHYGYKMIHMERLTR